MTRSRTPVAAILGLGLGMLGLGFIVVAQEPPSVDRVRAALRIAEFDRALLDAQALTRIVPDSADALAVLGDAHWGAGQFDEADSSYAKALAIDPASPRARFGEARSLLSRSRLGEALDRTRAILGAVSGDADVHALHATVLERLGRFEEAAAAYEAYATLVPADDATAIQTSRSRAAFLRSFAGRMPRELSATDALVAHTVPFKLIRNKVVVQGRVNGTPVEWVVDTGAERTGISASLAASARMRPVASTLTAGIGPAALRRVQLARADTLEIGSLRVRNVPVSIRNAVANGAPRWQGESLSPLALGLSAIVDYRSRRVVLARTLPREPAAVTLPLRLYRLPLVRGTLNARHAASFVVDTGGEVISISSATADTLGVQALRRIPLRVYGLSGPDETAFLLPGVDLEFEEIAYRKIGLAVLNLRAPSVLLGFQLGGIVGHKFLDGYRVAFDVERSELRLGR